MTTRLPLVGPSDVHILSVSQSVLTEQIDIISVCWIMLLTHNDYHFIVIIQMLLEFAGIFAMRDCTTCWQRNPVCS